MSYENGLGSSLQGGLGAGQALDGLAHQLSPLQAKGINIRGGVSRQDLIDMSLKLQEALSLVTQAMGRLS